MALTLLQPSPDTIQDTPPLTGALRSLRARRFGQRTRGGSRASSPPPPSPSGSATSGGIRARRRTASRSTTCRSAAGMRTAPSPTSSRPWCAYRIQPPPHPPPPAHPRPRTHPGPRPRPHPGPARHAPHRASPRARAPARLACATS
jgi:hypothetical protein